MAIRASELPTVLIRRIESSHPVPARFAIGETEEWPSGVLQALLAQGVLAETNRADVTTCPGCEMQCHKRVVVRAARTVSKATIMCDEEPGHGPITISMRSLRRFETGLRLLSTLISAELNIDPPVVSPNGAAYALGNVKGRHGFRRVVVSIDEGRLVLGVGEAKEPLGQALCWSATGLAVNAKVLRRLAERKGAQARVARSYVPDRSAQQARKRETRRRDIALFNEAKKRFNRAGATWSSVADELAGSPFAPRLKGQAVRRIISKMRADERK